MSAGNALAGLEALLEADRAATESALSEIVSEITAEPTSLADPIRYALAVGGKRLRPLLVVTGYRAVTADTPPRALYRLACALELIHTYSLIHDDLPCMDDDDLRRGRPTTHRVYGVPAATLAGASLIPAAFRVLSTAARALSLEPATRAALTRELAGAAGAGGMVGGQWLDLEAEGTTIAHAELEDIHARKTGALFAAALRIGALAAGASPDAVAALGRAGAAFGLAFQVTDDLLDATGQREALGKAAGRDRVLSKATFPELLGVDGARRRAARAAQEGQAALADAGLESEALTALLRFAAERDR